MDGFSSLELTQKDEEYKIASKALIIWDQPQPSSLTIGIHNKFEILLQFKDKSNIIQPREDIASGPDMRDTETKVDQDQNYLLNDGRFHALLNQSKDDCLTLHNRYPIRNRKTWNTSKIYD